MKHEQSVAQLKGAYSAIFTPFDHNNQVNFEVLTQITEFQLAAGLKGFFVAGSTGEGLLLSFEERIAVTKHVIDVCQERATVIAHVGHPSTDVASKLAVESANAGADWVASLAPIFYGNTFSGAMRHYRLISDATNLPFMIYSLGGEIDCERDVAFFELPNVCGLKYTGANFFSVQQLARRLDRPVAFMSGFDEQFVAGQSFGFSGGIGSTYNFGPQFYAAIYRNYQQGNIAEAARLQAEINKVTHLMVKYENWSYRKAIMKYIGFDCGACRPPYAALSDAEYQSFAAELDGLGVLERDRLLDE